MLLRRWLDDVRLPGFADGPTAEDRKLTGLPICFAVSTGIKHVDDASHGRSKYTVSELLTPLHATAGSIGTPALEPFNVYGAEYSPTEQEIAASTDQYLGYLEAMKASALEGFSV